MEILSDTKPILDPCNLGHPCVGKLELGMAVATEYFWRNLKNNLALKVLCTDVLNLVRRIVGYCLSSPKKMLLLTQRAIYIALADAESKLE